MPVACCLFVKYNFENALDTCPIQVREYSITIVGLARADLSFRWKDVPQNMQTASLFLVRLHTEATSSMSLLKHAIRSKGRKDYRAEGQYATI